VGLRRRTVARNGRLALHPPDLAGNGDVFRFVFKMGAGRVDPLGSRPDP